jgi:tetratricopeptide (TPR) repeat protein
MPIYSFTLGSRLCSLSDADAWIGRAINVAKRVEAVAELDSLLITQMILELIDLPFYDFSEFGMHQLKGDMLLKRPVYRRLAVIETAMAERQASELSAEDWFLRGVGISGTACQGLQEEADCYRQALQLRENYPEAYAEAHFNYATLLERGSDFQAAADHYKAALKILPGYLVAHNNLAALLYENGDLEEAQAHYRAALRIRPTDPVANYNLGLLLHAKGDEKAAEHHLEIAWR